MHDIRSKDSASQACDRQTDAVDCDAVSDMGILQDLVGPDREHCGSPASLNLPDGSHLLYDSSKHI